MKSTTESRLQQCRSATGTVKARIWSDARLLARLDRGYAQHNDLWLANRRHAELSLMPVLDDYHRDMLWRLRSAMALVRANMACDEACRKAAR